MSYQSFNEDIIPKFIHFKQMTWIFEINLFFKFYFIFLSPLLSPLPHLPPIPPPNKWLLWGVNNFFFNFLPVIVYELVLTEVSVLPVPQPFKPKETHTGLH